jgi:hypothetical protein
MARTKATIEKLCVAGARVLLSCAARVSTDEVIRAGYRSHRRLLS